MISEEASREIAKKQIVCFLKDLISTCWVDFILHIHICNSHLFSLPFCSRACLSELDRSVHTYVFLRVIALAGMLFWRRRKACKLCEIMWKQRLPWIDLWALPVSAVENIKELISDYSDCSLQPFACKLCSSFLMISNLMIYLKTCNSFTSLIVSSLWRIFYFWFPLYLF